ncbi:MAG: amino acid permease [Vulcanimicrobiaceae bacterium]
MKRIKPLAQILAEGSDEKRGLKRSLGPWALAAMGIGAIIGTGIFVLTGVAAATRAGPALTISFVVAGIVSALAALCYAEVSSKIPISGSAYTYAYATLGELVAWIIGWDLILEYALGAATVSIGWAGYFGNFLTTAFGITLPARWSHSPFDVAANGAPLHGIINAPAAIIILLITALLVRGTRESGLVNGIIVGVKLAIVAFFLIIGVQHIDPANYHLAAGPMTGMGGYFPFGWTGVFGGAAFIFFAYIGFDAVSTTAEEAKNPSRDLPFGILMSLAICTVLYIAVVAVLTGMVPFNDLNVASPVAYAVIKVGLPWAGLIISLGAIAGLTTVLLVMMFGQSRIIFAMSRDGLIPKWFTAIHPTFRTPIFSTIFFGILIAAAAALTPIDIVGSLTNMGTLIAFVLVSIAVPLLRTRHPELKGGFTVPLGNYFLPILSALASLGLIYSLKFQGSLWHGIPIAWIGFIIWMGIGLAIYLSYGRTHSTVALQVAEGGLAARQPPVN